MNFYKKTDPTPNPSPTLTPNTRKGGEKTHTQPDQTHTKHNPTRTAFSFPQVGIHENFTLLTPVRRSYDRQESYKVSHVESFTHG
jgi:hypothetical protein